MELFYSVIHINIAVLGRTIKDHQKRTQSIEIA